MIRNIIHKVMMLLPAYRKACFVEQTLIKESAEIKANDTSILGRLDKLEELALTLPKMCAQTSVENKAGIDQLSKRLDLMLMAQRFLTQYDAKPANESKKNEHFVSYTYPTICWWWGVGECNNLGDWIQTIATEGAIRQAVGTDVRFEEVPRDSLVAHSGGTCVMQGWYSNSTLNFLPGPDTRAVWVGTHLNTATREALEFLWTRHPYSLPREIGCRDLSTLEFCKRDHIEAYFSRCLTLTLPRRTQADICGDVVYCVDCPDWLLEALPEDIRAKAVVLSQRKFKGGDPATCRKAAEQTLERYRKTASLVITTGLHCAQPCLAMGIPVVLVSPAYEEADRFSALKGILRVYSREDVVAGNVNYNPQAVDIEDLKKLLIRNLQLSINPPDDKQELHAVRAAIAAYSKQ